MLVADVNKADDDCWLRLVMLTEEMIVPSNEKTSSKCITTSLFLHLRVHRSEREEMSVDTAGVGQVRKQNTLTFPCQLAVV